MTRTSLTVLLVVSSITAVWCYFEVAAIMNPRWGPTGFHPLVLFALPLGGILSAIVLALAISRKSFALGGLSVLPIVALLLPILYGYDLGIAGWSQEISRFASENEAAIRNTDFSSADFDEVPYKDHERMVEVRGFRWSNSDTMIAAKDGVFFGFTVNNAPHVYMSPVMNGARGVAWLTDSSTIDSDPRVKYEHAGVANWYIWTMSL